MLLKIYRSVEFYIKNKMIDFSLSNIKKGIRTFYPVSNYSLRLLFKKNKRLELPKKSLIIKAGVINRHVYLI